MAVQDAGSIAKREVFQDLYGSRAQLLNSVSLKDKLGFALWENDFDEVSYTQPGHHTLSCYVSGGYQMERIIGSQVAEGGAPQKLCLMPSEQEYVWKVKDAIRLMHFYFSDHELIDLGEKVWDKSIPHILLDDKTFLEDSYLATIFLQMVGSLNWQDRADQVALYSSSQMLMVHILKNYCSRSLCSPRMTGGLTGYQVRRVNEFVQAHLGDDISLPQLAAQVDLSEYHFARMFKKTTGQTPHQFVTSQRIELSKRLLKRNDMTLSDIALQAGFSNQSHFSSRFRQWVKMTPKQYRLDFNALTYVNRT